ncbi:MAG: tRNA preQ1(34) S-adenosylmethionine ribosyltransferase-isomerase QueA [Myxococcota bacterium]|nr:tRNA preQ1(34) S-adenosylmethionine ribosyltransferase-isomerase QueA [Myxococcota bacterium]
MELDDFDFHLPRELIAQTPSQERGGSRLLSLPHVGDPIVGDFKGLIDAFSGDEVLVLNDTRVVPARLRARRESGGERELFFLESVKVGQIKALTKGKIRVGETLSLPGEVYATLIERLEGGEACLALSGAPLKSGDAVEWSASLFRWLEEAGEVPLPPYIERQPDEEDKARYQTVFAQKPGAIAAPTAGLHFTETLLTALESKGVQRCTLTLHVGLGTFSPIRDTLEGHKMHNERYEIPPETWALVQSGRPVISVGTTALRALESEAINPGAGNTELFIKPGFPFHVVDGLITNFHLPKSTLFMLVSAFVGRARALEAYRHAVAARMRFYSYGDACLFRRAGGRWGAGERS